MVEGIVLTFLGTAATVLATKYYAEKIVKMKQHQDDQTAFLGLAQTLANDYTTIYYVNVEDDSYAEYGAAGIDKKLTKLAEGRDFFTATVRDAKSIIYSEDLTRFLSVFTKERLLRAAKNNDNFSLDYRLLVQGKPRYYRLKLIRGMGEGDKHLILGARDVDEQIKREAAAEEEHITFSRLALSLANDYLSIYYINTEDDSYVEYGATGKEKKLKVLSQGSDFFADTEKNSRTLIYEEDQERFLASINKKAILDAMQEEESFSLNYRLVIDGEPVHYYLKTIKGTGEDDKYIIIGVRNVDAQTKREAAAAEESETYSRIAKALATPYEVIYYVDTVTDEYIEYSSSEKYTKLRVGMRGHDFFSDTQRNMKHDIFRDDYPMMAAAMQKERFLKELNSAGTYSLTYRLMIDKKPEYANLRAVKSGMDDEHVIVAVSNIDASMRREMALRKELGTAMHAANQDSLTGVNSRHAYLKAVDYMNDEIEQGADYEFAMIVFDINDLKKVNDTKGHSAGDEHIKSACSMFCTVFKRSQVYRIGGDEFVAMLTDDDYADRKELFEVLQKMVMDNKKNGLVTIASGMAEYDKNCDRNVKDVFERADNAMYANKKSLKNV